MSQEITRNLGGDKPFEERVFARFDGIQEFLRSLDSRVGSLDSRVQVLESRAYDTKPIWERALKEILENRLEFGELKTEVAGLKTEVAGLRRSGGEVQTSLTGLQTEVGGLKGSVTQLQTDVGGLKGSTTGLQSKVVELETQVKDLTRQVKREIIKRLDQIQSLHLQNKVDIQDAEDRLDKLESRVA